MRILLTAGPTREPIDPVRYVGNRSSGTMGAAIADGALRGGHQLTLVAGPVSVSMPGGLNRINVETAGEMLDAVMREFSGHDLLIMAAAVADYRPKKARPDKVPRQAGFIIEFEATEDIVATAAATKRADQRVVGFSLESGGIERAIEKLHRKKLDLIVYNPTQTIASTTVEPVLLWPDGRRESPGSLTKTAFADLLLARSARLW